MRPGLAIQFEHAAEPPRLDGQRVGATLPSLRGRGAECASPENCKAVGGGYCRPCHCRAIQAKAREACAAKFRPIVTSIEEATRGCEPGSAKIVLTRGYVAIVDEGDFGWLSQWRWCAGMSNGLPYAIRYAGPAGSQVRVSMHRLLLGITPGQYGDHRDGNTLNNRRSNLRPATYSQNNRNAGVRKDNRLGLKGVRADKKKFCARIFVDGRVIHIGNFPDPVSAARAYDRAARQHFGEFARLNFPEEVAA